MFNIKNMVFKMHRYLFIVMMIFMFLPNLMLSQKVNHYELGDSYFQSKLYERAVEEFSKAIEEDSQKGYAHYKRGIAYLYMNKFDEAINDFNEALKENDKDPDSYNSRGLARSYKGELAEAMEDFNKAIKFDPTFSQAYINRGSAYSAMKDYTKAIKDFDIAVKLDSKNPELFVQRASLFYAKNDFKNAVKDYTAAIKLGLGRAKVYFNRANAYFKLEKYNEAIKDYSTAVELDPDDIDALNNRAYTYKLLKKDAEAEKDRTLVDEIKNKTFTPVDKLNFVPFSNKEGDVTLNLPDNWRISEMPGNTPDKTEFIISPENINPESEGMMVGVTVGIMKNMSKNTPAKSESEILDFWKGSMDLSNEELFIYKVEWQKHMQLYGHATILNRSVMQATENHIQFGLFEYALAWGDNLVYLYFQAPETNFNYYEKLYEVAYKSLKINDAQLIKQ